MTSRLWLVALVVIAAVLSPSTHAQVYALGDDGALTVRDGSGAVTWHDPGAPVAMAPMAGIASPASVPDGYRAAMQQSAARYSLNPSLFEALVWQESRWHSGAVSPKGAVGLTQLMPATAQALGVDPHDPLANLDAGARYLRILLDHFGGDVIKALAAYNAGIKRVESAGGVPPIRETQAYVAAIMARINGHIAAR
jgi:soluble lytic murein transglycosylase-like protein